jgi:hypothetical protein
MSPDLVLIVLVAVAAFAAGYYIGRLKVLAEPPQGPRYDDNPLPGPDLDGPLAGPSPAPIPRGPAPPVPAGDSRRTPPRRSTTPPPAAAGLMGKGGEGKPDRRPK